jgi:hypothetical protein
VSPGYYSPLFFRIDGLVLFSRFPVTSKEDTFKLLLSEKIKWEKYLYGSMYEQVCNHSVPTATLQEAMANRRAVEGMPNVCSCSMGWLVVYKGQNLFALLFYAVTK